MKYNTLIFDFDGTIADTLDEGLMIYNDLAQQHRFLHVEASEVAELRHLTMNQLFKHLGISKHRAPKVLYQATRMLKSRIAQLPLIDGMSDVLPSLFAQGKQLGILTSNSVENVSLFLSLHRLDGLFSFVSSTSKLSGKARHLRSIQKSYQLDADEMIYIGDEIRDVRAAKKAGVAVAAVAWGFNSSESLSGETPQFLLNHPTELMNLS